MSILAIARNFNGNPNIVTMVTDDNLTAITTTGYWNLPTTVASVEQVQNGVWQWEPNDLVLINYSPELVGFFLFDPLNFSFDALAPNGGVADTLPSGEIFVGNAFNIATPVPMSGDIGIDNTGATAIQSGVIVNADVNASAAIAYSKLAALPSADILVGSAGNVATAVAMTGDIAISDTGVTAIQAGVIVNSEINAAAAIDFSKLATLAPANILVGSAGSVATSVAMSGDVTISDAGVTAIGAGVVVDANVNASAAIAFSKLASLPSADILVGSAGNVATAVSMSGDATLDNAGVLTIATGAVSGSKIANNAVDYAQLALEVSASATVALTAAQIKALYDTPVQLIAAPGVGKLVIIDSILWDIAFGTLQYTAGGVLAAQYGNAVHGLGPVASGTLDAASLNGVAASGFLSNDGIAGNLNVAASGSLNTAVYLSNQTADFATGDSTVNLYVRYRVVTPA